MIMREFYLCEWKHEKFGYTYNPIKGIIYKLLLLINKFLTIAVKELIKY